MKVEWERAICQREDAFSAWIVSSGTNGGVCGHLFRACKDQEIGIEGDGVRDNDE